MKNIENRTSISSKITLGGYDEQVRQYCYANVQQPTLR